MKKIVFSVAVSLLSMILSQSAYVGASPTSVLPNVVNALQADGQFEVSVFNDGQWQQVGLLNYDRFLKIKKICFSFNS